MGAVLPSMEHREVGRAVTNMTVACITSEDFVHIFARCGVTWFNMELLILKGCCWTIDSKIHRVVF